VPGGGYKQQLSRLSHDRVARLDVGGATAVPRRGRATASIPAGPAGRASDRGRSPLGGLDDDRRAEKTATELPVPPALRTKTFCLSALNREASAVVRGVELRERRAHGQSPTSLRNSFKERRQPGAFETFAQIVNPAMTARPLFRAGCPSHL